MTAGSGSWYQLLDILREHRAEHEQEMRDGPLSCPNDGEPLLPGPHGERYCRYDGWRWQG